MISPTLRNRRCAFWSTRGRNENRGQLARAHTSEGFCWGYLLDRLSLAGEQWRSAMKAVLPQECIHALAAAFNRLEVADLRGT